VRQRARDDVVANASVRHQNSARVYAK
jgi:hypothetical protein